MKIGPVPPIRQGVGETPVQNVKDKEPSQKASPAVDTAEFSDHARAQIAKLADEARLAGPIAEPREAESGGMRMDKVKLAVARMRSGYYDQREIQEHIAGRLADELFDRPPDGPETSE